jgi:xylan 1,4-beta-xylosidase
MAKPEFTCNLDQAPSAFPHFWEHTVGSGHAPLALRADWQAQLRRCHAELGFRHVRFHGILSYPMDTLICQGDEWLYSFFNADQIVDYLLSNGLRPFVELSFMPEALASGSEIVFHYRSNVTPPKDYGQWDTLIQKLVGHWVDRYGLGEVSQWFFEVWNEPNLSAFWSGSQQEYFRLYHHTAEAIKGVDPALRVGGPATADNAWIEPFLDFCEGHRLPLDFVSTHFYPTDAFGEIGADTETQLAHAGRGVMRQKAEQVRHQVGDRPLYYTEWSVSSNPRGPYHDVPFAAAFATRIIMTVSGLVQGYSYWTFSDIFQENYFPSLPFQGGFGLLNIHGIPKPVYRAFQLLHQLGDEQWEVEGEHDTIDAWVVSKKGADGSSNPTVQVLMTNHAAPRHPIRTELASVALTGMPEPRGVHIQRIDETHANARREWEAMREPRYLSSRDVDRLEVASQLVKDPYPWQYGGDTLLLNVDLPPHAVALVTLELPTEEPERKQVQ